MKEFVDNLICIYSSHKDKELAENLKEYILKYNTLKSFRVLIVLTDAGNDFEYKLRGDYLFLNIKECYTYLSLKTECMINACCELFDFNYLVKWDASTIDKKRCYPTPEGEYNDYYENNLEILNKGSHMSEDYFSHLIAACNGLQSTTWCKKHKPFVLPILEAEGRDLEMKEFLPNAVKYYKGKFYVLSERFCKFIKTSDRCREIFKENFLHNFGAEDMSVGQCYKNFKTIHDKR